MGNDRCAEMPMRMPSGEPRTYKGHCGTSYQPGSSHSSLGKGWNDCDVLTAPGDLTDDVRTDLLARRKSIGDMYLFAAKSNGTLAAGRKIATGWKGCKKIVGAGDLDGDGIGDVLALDGKGTLYRYDGRGSGPLKKRVKVFTKWATSTT
ncbi:hypothetical protein [Streptomyces sp. NPDC001292]|uniref:hypothetical protein n=1 Tax=Streptomyces sp. NPDC001292 TaxID=3364558 RepID=UPI0036C39FBE